MSPQKSLISAFVFLCAVSSGLFKQLPDYIQVCKRDQNTIEACVLKTIEALKPQLTAGIPEIDVPSIDPFFIPEIKALTASNSPVRASGHNIKVTGASEFKIKSLSIDFSTFTIRARVKFPKLHLEGDYKLDAQVLALPLKGQGKLSADAVKCEAEIVLHGEVINRDGAEYVRFKKMDNDIRIKDYRIRLDGLFDGDKTLGDAANAAINQNRADFLRTTKPHLERTVSRILLDIANKFVDGFTLEELLPKP